MLILSANSSGTSCLFLLNSSSYSDDWKISFLFILSAHTGRCVSIKTSGPIQKPLPDENEYKGITLSNKMEILLIRDFKATEASIGFSIGIGSTRNPRDVPGISHLLSHSLFDKGYTEGHALSNLVGNITELPTEDDTSFYFECPLPALNETLQRFIRSHFDFEK